MTAQAPPPRVILTRPAVQARRFAAALRRAVPGLRIMIAPLMEEVLLHPVPELAGRGVILTSETGVRAAVRLIPSGGRGAAWCVGPRTAAAARRAGFAAQAVGGDADALVAALARPGPPLVHLRGEEARGDVARRLTAAGRATDEVVVYRQEARSLTPRARAVLGGPGPVIVPLFSPRSAALFRAAVPAPGAGVTLAAFSPAVAAELPPGPRVLLTPRPEGPAMIALIAGWAAEMRLTPLSDPQADGRAVRAMESES